MHRYAPLVKNLRGVVYFKATPKILMEKVEWLRKHFKYRNIGVPPCFREYSGGVLVELAFPASAFKTFVEAFSKEGLNREALEALTLALVYVSPLYLLEEEALRDFEKIVIGSVKTEKELDTRSWKLHLRIADYSVLDMYAWSSEHGFEALKRLAASEDISGFLEERKKRVEKDRRRYWRIIGEKGRDFLVYLDPLLLFEPETATLALKILGEFAPSVLGICVAVVL